MCGHTLPLIIYLFRKCTHEKKACWRFFGGVDDGVWGALGSINGGETVEF